MTRKGEEEKVGVKHREGVSGKEGGNVKFEVINRKGCVREKREKKWEDESRLSGEEKISQEERGVKKGQAEREESSAETTGEHKTKEKDRREDRRGEEKRGGELRMSREEKTREEIMGEETKERAKRKRE